MSTNSRQSDSAPEAIEVAAIEWLLEREEGFSPQRAREFAAWCAASPRHSAEIAKAEAAMDLIAELPKARALLQPAAIEPFPPARKNHRAWRWIAWSSGLAALFLVAGLAWWRLPAPAGDDAFRYVTGAGHPQLVALDDGSLVDVNANSALRVRLLPAERQVELSAGEAHFEVAHDSARPFIVRAGGVAVRAVGTAFNVRMHDGVVEVLVTEGKVEVTRNSGPNLRTPRAEAPLVVAHERVRIDHGSGSAALVVEKVDAQVVQTSLAWHTQITNFSNRPLGEIVTIFNRRNVTQLLIADRELADRRIGGAFAIDRPLAFVRVLEQDGEIVAQRRGDHTIVLRRAR